MEKMLEPTEVVN